MSLDGLIVSYTVFFWAVFFLLQLIVLRLMHPNAVLKGIGITFTMVCVLHFLGSFLWVDELHNQAVWGMFWVVSFALLTLGAFVYVVCIFGPSETSIRIRLIRELLDAKGRLSHEALLQQYNGAIILQRRLERLVLSGEIKLEGQRYQLIRTTNPFFVIETLAQLIKRILKKS